MPHAAHRIARALLLGFICFAFISTPLLALEQTAVSDILKQPVRYGSNVVKIAGEVMKVEPDPIRSGTGTYTVLDSSDSIIRVLANKELPLPKIGEQMYVVGLVYQDDPQAKPYLEELKRGSPGPSMKLLVGAAGVLALAAFILLYLLLWHHGETPKGSKPAEEQPVRKRAITQVFQDDPVAVLSAIAGPHKGQTYNIFRGITTIGRENDRTIHLAEDQTVSRQQARLMAEDGAVSLVNESSTNPTKVDGEPVEKRELSDGDVIQMGSTKLKLTVLEQ